MRIVVMPGSHSPKFCGIGDYTTRLIHELRALSIDIKVLAGNNWNLYLLGYWLRKFIAYKPDILHIQYPAFVYKTSLLPQILTCIIRRFPVLCTIHEFRESHFLRKVAIVPFFLMSRHIIFTNIFERKYVSRILPFIRKKSSVIPIGSSIPPVDYPINRDQKSIVYFGLIMPNKGIEKFISLARYAHCKHFDYAFIIIGAVNDRHRDYYERLSNFNKDINITWRINYSSEDVAKFLASATYAYLPFPDGASERRSSLLAALNAGLIVLTTEGRYTTDEIQSTVKIVNSNEEILYLLREIDNNENMKKEYLIHAMRYIRKRSWDNIARCHIKLYAKYL